VTPFWGGRNEYVRFRIFAESFLAFRENLTKSWGKCEKYGGLKKTTKKVPFNASCKYCGVLKRCGV
jgi:hypothetical protein